jgi:hypothetical protein
MIGSDSEPLRERFKEAKISGLRKPYVVMADKYGNILYSSSGYRIGVGEQILRNSR